MFVLQEVKNQTETPLRLKPRDSIEDHVFPHNKDNNKEYARRSMQESFGKFAREKYNIPNKYNPTNTITII